MRCASRRGFRRMGWTMAGTRCTLGRYLKAMKIWMRLLRRHHVLVALVLLLGHLSAGVVVSPCMRLHEGMDRTAALSLMGGGPRVESDAVAVESTVPVPHDHGSDLPIAPGVSGCGSVMLAGAAPECHGATEGRVASMVPWDLAPPTSRFPSPPYQPPRV